jgi:uncharacterized protein
MPSLQLIHPQPQADRPAQSYFLAPEKLISGNPQQQLWPQYQDARGHFMAGIWASEVGCWHIGYTEEEYCQILDGVSIVTDAQGLATTLRPGDCFVIPRGFTGTWEVLEATRKLYVMHEDGRCP